MAQPLKTVKPKLTISDYSRTAEGVPEEEIQAPNGIDFHMPNGAIIRVFQVGNTLQIHEHGPEFLVLYAGAVSSNTWNIIAQKRI